MIKMKNEFFHLLLTHAPIILLRKFIKVTSLRGAHRGGGAQPERLVWLAWAVGRQTMRVFLGLVEREADHGVR
jgi:hypothetical protein